MNRRKVVASAMGLAALGLGLPRTAARTLAQAAGGRQPTGTPYPLVALPGKAPLGQVYDIPPNYEVPTPHLIGTAHHPFTDNAYYYVRSREPGAPQIVPSEFRLTVGGDHAEKTLTLSLADLQRFPQVEVGAVGTCGGFGDGLFRPLVAGPPWSKGDVSCAVWGGASLQAVLQEAGIKPGATLITFRAAGTTIDRNDPHYLQTYLLKSVLQPNALLAYRMNGEELTLWNGFPLRLVVPGTFAPRWVKQVTEIQLRATPDPRDYSEGPPGEDLLDTYSLTTDPPDGTRVAVGQSVALRGIAWDAGQGIVTVETSVDGGKSWRSATMEPSYGQYVWRVWHQTVTVTSAGVFPVLTRATSADGQTQALDVEGKNWNASRPFAALLVGV